MELSNLMTPVLPALVHQHLGGKGRRWQGVTWAQDENWLYALTGVAQWIEHGLQTKRLLVQFLVRAYAWVVGQIPSWGHVRGNHTLVFLSLSFSLPSPLSKDK